MEVTALMVASQHGHEGVVCLLLEWGSDVNFSQRTTLWGPLMAATLSGKVGGGAWGVWEGWAPPALLFSCFVVASPGCVCGTDLAGALVQVAVAQQLVERGSDPDRVNVLAQTAFELSMQLKQRELRAYLDPITTVRPQTGESSWSPITTLVFSLAAAEPA